MFLAKGFSCGKNWFFYGFTQFNIAAQISAFSYLYICRLTAKK